MTGAAPKRYAIVRAGIVENVVLLEDESEWSPPQDGRAALCPDHIGIGLTYDDGNRWAAPASSAGEEESAE